MCGIHRIGAAFALVAFPAVLFAQPVPDDAIVVEATRFPQQVRRLPASTTVISAEDIKASAARTLPELLNEQVGLRMSDLYGNNASTTSIDLRGYGATAAQNTLILLDGRRLNDIDLSGVQWSAVPLASIERIEILRGTGAVLYGDAASSGVVNIVSRSPLKQGPAFQAWGRAASYNTLEGQAYGSYASGALGLNASVYGYGSDGYRANNRNEQQNNAMNLRWALGEGALDLRLGNDRQRLRLPGARRVQPSIGLDEYAADPRGAQTPLDYASRVGQRAGATLVQRLGEAELSVGLDHRDKDQRSFFDQGGFPTYRADALDLNSFTPRLRVPFATGSLRHRVTLGADWHDWKWRSRRTDRPENLAQPTNVVTIRQKTEGYYVQDTVDLTQTTLLNVGWRTERAKYSGDDVVDATAPACFFCSAAPSLRATQSQEAWELGVRQAFGAEWALFGRAGRSFRLVNAEELYESDIFFSPQFQLLRPQHARTVEAGAEWRRGTRVLRAALFRSDVSDEIHLDPFTTGVGNTNLPPSRRQGLELDGRWQASEALRFTAGYAYTEARFLEGVLPGSPFAIGTGLSIAGRTVPLVPRHKLNVGLAWDLAARTRVSGALTGVSSQVLDNDEPNTLGRRIPSYAVADLKIAHDLGWGRIALALNNVFNQHYYTYAVRSAFVADRYAVYPLPGRTIGVTVELSI